jgi:hypothetical protein
MMEFQYTAMDLSPQESLLSLTTMSRFGGPVAPDEHSFTGRDPWFDRPFDRPFDRLTVLSKVEGGSREYSI